MALFVNNWRQSFIGDLETLFDVQQTGNCRLPDCRLPFFEIRTNFSKLNQKFFLFVEKILNNYGIKEEQKKEVQVCR